MLSILIVAILWRRTFLRKGYVDANDSILVLSLGLLSLLFLGRSILFDFGVVVAPGNSRNTLFIGLYTITAYTLYPLRKILHRLLHSGRIVYIFTPLFAVAVIFYFMKLMGCRFEEFNTLYIFRDELLREPTIAARVIVVTTSTILALLPGTLCIAHKIKSRLLWALSCMPLAPGAVVLTYFITVATSGVVGMLYHIWTLLFLLFIAYAFVYKNINRELENPTEDPAAPTYSELLWERLEEYMVKQEPWRAPDLKLEELAQMACTNRTTLSALIRERGGETFNDYISNYRVAAFCHYARNNKIDNVVEALMSVGFRSTSTAFKHFRRVTGLTPSQYLKKLEIESHL